MIETRHCWYNLEVRDNGLKPRREPLDGALEKRHSTDLIVFDSGLVEPQHSMKFRLPLMLDFVCRIVNVKTKAAFESWKSPRYLASATGIAIGK